MLYSFLGLAGCNSLRFSTCAIIIVGNKLLNSVIWIPFEAFNAFSYDTLTLTNIVVRVAFNVKLLKGLQTASHLVGSRDLRVDRQDTRQQ